MQLDTGLTRLGLQAQHLSLLQAGADLWQDAQPVAWISHLGHFEAPSDARNQVQKQLFDQWTAHLPAAERSLAASSCVFADAQWHYDHARVGSALYGVATTAGQPLEVVARLQAPILRIADVPAGVEVGYGDRFRTPRPMRIATVAIGYGDGLPFSGLQQCSLRLHGRAAPVVGGVAMGLLALDVSEFTAPELATGQWVEVYGEQQRIEALAMTAGLASNALLVPTARLSQRSYAGLSRAAVP